MSGTKPLICWIKSKRQTSWPKTRYSNYKSQPLHYSFPNHFDGKLGFGPMDQSRAYNQSGYHTRKGAIVSVKWPMPCIWQDSMKDVHMTDLISGRENLEGIQFIGAVGGFSNSDVLGSAKGWAGAFLYNEKPTPRWRSSLIEKILSPLVF